MPEKPVYIHGSDPEEQRRLSLMNDAINGQALRELDLKGGVRILDVGCGLAQFTRLMAGTAQSGTAVVGIERDETQLVEASRLLQDDGDSGEVELRCGDALNLPLADEEWESFDVVHSRFLLEHLPQPQRAVDQMIRAVKPNGRIILQDDDHDVMRFWPPIPELVNVWRAYVETYAHAGNDGYIGRKLVELLVNGGATPAKTTWLFYGACAGHELFEPLTTNLLGVLTGAADAILACTALTRENLDCAFDRFRSWCRLPHAALWYAICWAEGTKPGRLAGGRGK